MAGDTGAEALNPRFPNLVYDAGMRTAAALAIAEARETGQIDYKTLVQLHNRATYGRSTGQDSAMSAFVTLAGIAQPGAFDVSEGPAREWIDSVREGSLIGPFPIDDAIGAVWAARTVQVQPDNR